LKIMSRRKGMISLYQLELYRKGKLVKKFPDVFFTEAEANLFAKTYLRTRRKKSLSIKRIKSKFMSLEEDIPDILPCTLPS